MIKLYKFALLNLVYNGNCCLVRIYSVFFHRIDGAGIHSFDQLSLVE